MAVQALMPRDSPYGTGEAGALASRDVVYDQLGDGRPVGDEAATA